MAVKVLPIEVADLPAFGAIYGTAHTHGISPFLGNDPEATKRHFVEKHSEGFGADPSVKLLKAVDTETGAVLACAKWCCFTTERSAEEIAEAAEKPPCPAGANPEAWEDMFSWLQDARTRLKGGQKCWFLNTLVADHAHRGRGAGGLLIKWGCDRADEMDLPAWLESTSKAQPLYERYGFEAVERRTFDLSKYGGQGTDWNTAMCRKRRSDRGPGATQ